MKKIEMNEDTILQLLSIALAIGSFFVKGRKAVRHDEALKAEIENDIYRNLGLIEEKGEN